PHGPLLIIGTAADHLVSQSGRNDFERIRGSDLPDASKFGPLGALLSDTGQMPEPLYLRAPDAKPHIPANTVRIRSIDAGHSPGVAAIHAECFGKAWDAEAFAKLIASGAHASIAMEGEEPLGFILVRPAADEAEIITIATRPHARRRGIARALVRDQLQHLGA